MFLALARGYIRRLHRSWRYEMFEIIRWVSLGLLWVALVINVWGVVRNHRLFKEWELLIEDLRSRIEAIKKD